jgi:hypothetical protein
MRFTFFFSLLILVRITSIAQLSTKTTGFYSTYSTIEKLGSTDSSHVHSPSWSVSFYTHYQKQKTDIFETKKIKDKNFNQRLATQLYGNAIPTANKTTANQPSIGVNFKANQLKTWTPTDNAIAISDSGILVSCTNYGIAYYHASGATLMSEITWDAFLNNSSLIHAKFDPRVLFDRLHQRFIVVLLHGFSSTTNKILVCFSQTSNPVDGWHYYQLPGNPYNDTTWSDYPTIGINDDDLFINTNRFGDAPLYSFKETYLYQIRLSDGYAGQPLTTGLWNNLQAPDGTPGITLYPASDGFGKSLKEKMYFVQLRPDFGSSVYVYTLTGKLGMPNQTMQVTQYPIDYYEACANAFQRDPTTNQLDSLITGAAWTQNAFYANNVLHYTHTSNVSGTCGIRYGRIWLDSGIVHRAQYALPTTDFAYPAIASIGYDSNDKSVAIAYVQSDSSMTPQCGVITVDDSFTWSNPQVVKAGDTAVNILYPPDYPIMPERWGDYTGICRRYNSNPPEAWMAAAYGANTPPRLASYSTWIAQIITGEDSITTPSSTGTFFSSVRENRLYPNPASSQFQWKFSTKESGRVIVSIINMQGQIIKVLFDDVLQPSAHELTFNQTMLPAGHYVLIAECNGQIVAKEKLSVR